MDEDRSLPMEGEPGGEEPGSVGGTPGVAELSALLSQKDEEIGALREQVKRQAAEFENFRRRQEAERLRRLDQMKEELIRSLLPMVDHLERAASAARAGAGVEAMVQGIELVLRDTHRILEGHGVTAIEPVNQPFDPGLHEAVLTEEREDVPDETVVEEFRRGYLVGDRLLRPSQVKVARHPSPGPEE